MKNIIITGTSRGIGFDLVKLCSEQNNNIIALSRNAENISKLKLKNVFTLPFDITKDDDYIELKDLIKNKFNSKIDILINNAGKLINKPFLELTKQDFDDCYNTNVYGVAKMIQSCIPFFSNEAHSVIISSIGGIQGSVKFAGLTAYSTSKGAVITLNEMIAEEYKDTNFAFNVLALGAVQTEMLEEAFPGYEAQISAKEMAKYILNFSLNSSKFISGKTIQVSNSTP